MTKEAAKTKGKELSKSTKFRIRQYVLLAESVLLIAASALALYSAYKLDLPKAGEWLAVVAGVYALLEGLGKLDKAIVRK